MIRVNMAPEPPDFDRKVRAPGTVFLRRFPCPTSKDFRGKDYWKNVLPHVRRAYRSLCAYCACWIPGQGSIDHFRPKSVVPALAYEWSNYRLAFEKLNSYKGNRDDIADPFAIGENWFVLNFTNFHVIPGDDISDDEQKLVQRTIRVLRLNKDDSLVDWRFSVVQSYSWGHTTFPYLQGHFPFIAKELRRQGLEEKIKRLFPPPGSA